FAAGMGVLAVRDRRWGYAGLAAFGAIGLAAAVGRPTADALSPIPSLVGVAAGAWAMTLLLRTSGSGVGSAMPARPGRRKGAMPGGRGSAGVGEPAAYDRRRFLITGLALGGGALVAGLGSRLAGRSA